MPHFGDTMTYMDNDMTRRTSTLENGPMNERNVTDAIEQVCNSANFFAYTKGVKWEMMAHAFKQCLIHDSFHGITRIDPQNIQKYCEEYLDFFFHRVTN